MVKQSKVFSKVSLWTKGLVLAGTVFVLGLPAVAGMAPFVTAHAGAMGTRANTLESVKTLVKTGVDALELDVSRRPSGLPVIIHNSAPKETEGEPLEPVLEVLAASNKRFLVDFKCGDRAFRLNVARLVAKKGMGPRTIFPCGDQTMKDAFLAACPGSTIFVGGTLSATPTPAELAKLDRLAALKPWAYNTCFRRLSPAAAAAVTARGMRLSLWTANSSATYDQCVKLGAYNVTTNWLPPEKVPASCPKTK